MSTNDTQTIPAIEDELWRIMATVNRLEDVLSPVLIPGLPCEAETSNWPSQSMTMYKLWVIYNRLVEIFDRIDIK